MAIHRYYAADGKLIPSVTTIVGQLDKPGLVYWANEIGILGHDIRTYVDDLAQVGTCAHQIIQLMLCGRDLQDVSNQMLSPPWGLPDPIKVMTIERALECTRKLQDWILDHSIEYVSCERELVSEKYRYGGRYDVYAEIDGVPTVIEIKTSKQIYDANKIQVAAYAILLREDGCEVEQAIIMRAGRLPGDGSQIEIMPKASVRKWERVYLTLLSLYRRLKKAKLIDRTLEEDRS